MKCPRFCRFIGFQFCGLLPLESHSAPKWEFFSRQNDASLKLKKLVGSVQKKKKERKDRMESLGIAFVAQVCGAVTGLSQVRPQWNWYPVKAPVTLFRMVYTLSRYDQVFSSNGASNERARARIGVFKSICLKIQPWNLLIFCLCVTWRFFFALTN